MHLGFANAADRRQLGDFLRVWGDVHQAFPRRPRHPTPEAIKLAERAFLPPRLLALGEKRLEFGAVDTDRPAIVDRCQALLEPVADRVAMDVKELRDLARIVEAACS